MPKNEEARWMRHIRRLVQPEGIRELLIVEASSASWMAQAVLMNGGDRRFRFQNGQLLDESLIGDTRV